MRWLVVLLVGLHINLPVYEMLRQEKHRLLRKYLQMQRQEMREKKVLDEIKASGKTPSGLRRRVDSSYALKHKELLKKYAQSSIVGNSKELLANQLEYETDIYVIKGHANIKGYIKDMLKDFLPIENSDDWIMSILSNNIKVDKDGEETLEICGVMG